MRDTFTKLAYGLNSGATETKDGLLEIANHYHLDTRVQKEFDKADIFWTAILHLIDNRLNEPVPKEQTEFASYYRVVDQLPHPPPGAFTVHDPVLGKPGVELMSFHLRSTCLPSLQVLHQVTFWPSHSARIKTGIAIVIELKPVKMERYSLCLSNAEVRALNCVPTILECWPPSVVSPVKWSNDKPVHEAIYCANKVRSLK
jgi:hypothetical protein